MAYRESVICGKRGAAGAIKGNHTREKKGSEITHGKMRVGRDPPSNQIEWGENNRVRVVRGEREKQGKHAICGEEGDERKAA